MNYSLPKTVEINGNVRAIRSDFREILDIMEALADDELSDNERGFVALFMFYPDFPDFLPEDYGEAIEKLFWFMNGGEEQAQGAKTTAKVVDWVKDISIIIPPVNRILGKDVREAEYIHWWTFLAAYYEIGDCLFAQVVSARQKMASGKKLDKSDREFIRRNKHLIEIKKPLTQTENEILSAWT